MTLQDNFQNLQLGIDCPSALKFPFGSRSSDFLHPKLSVLNFKLGASELPMASITLEISLLFDFSFTVAELESIQYIWNASAFPLPT